MIFNFILNKISGDYNQRQINKILPLVEKINQIDAHWDSLYNDEIKAKTAEFKKRYSQGESLDSLLPEAFAAVKQACKRLKWTEVEIKWQMITWEIVPYDVQLIWWIVLHQWKISEMRTWEWKTLVATLPAYLNAISGKWVHVVTVNDYLASRDAEWMAHVYNFLGISVGSVTKQTPLNKRREQYEKDITYVENSELWFDYLRDNLVKSTNDRWVLWRPLNYAIVDEVDSILIDEARTPLIISHPSAEPTEKYQQYAKIVKNLIPCKGKKKVAKGLLKELLSDDSDENIVEDGDYYIDEKLKTVTLTWKWIKKLEDMIWVEHLYKDLWFDEIHHIENALKAYAVYHNDKDYIIRWWEILIVDEHTWRTMPWRRYSEWLHQAIEAKEWVQIQRESKTLATITYQNFFKQYNKLSWMTGTATTEWEEFEKIYSLEVIAIPTNKNVIRVDKTDKVFFNQDAKWNAVVDAIKFYNEIGQPILIGTSSIHTSELVSNILRQINVPHYVLNAKYHEQEAQIVSNAWNLKSVVVATNMAWRWTDIKLKQGLNYELATNYATWISEQIKGNEFTKEDPKWVHAIVYSAQECDNTLQAIKQQFGLTDEELAASYNNYNKIDHAWVEFKVVVNWWKKSKEQKYADIYVKPIWSSDDILLTKDFHYWLFILGTEKHESRRIDNQLRGRAWRQWDTWISQFYVALDDEIMRKIWWEKIQAVANMLLPKDELAKMELVQSQFTSSIERAQKQMEGWHFGIRKHLFEYDSVINRQRTRIYQKRDDILHALDSTELEFNFVEEIRGFIDEIVTKLVKTYTLNHPWSIDELKDSILAIFNFAFTTEELRKFTNENDMRDYMVIKLYEYFDGLIKSAENEHLNRIYSQIYLDVIDKNWMDHIDEMQYLRENVGLYGYAQIDPLVIYKKEAFEKFEKLLFAIKEQVLWIVFRIDYNATFENLNQMQTQENINLNEISLNQDALKDVSELLDMHTQTISTDSVNTNGVEIIEVWENDRPVIHSDKVRPNDPCPCWSWKKYKKCHGANE